MHSSRTHGKLTQTIFQFLILKNLTLKIKLKKNSYWDRKRIKKLKIRLGTWYKPLPCTHLNARQEEKLQTLRKVIIRRPFWFGGLPPCESVLSEQIRRELVLHWGKFSDFILLKRDKKRFNRAIIIRAMNVASVRMRDWFCVWSDYNKINIWLYKKHNLFLMRSIIIYVWKMILPKQLQIVFLQTVF